VQVETSQQEMALGENQFMAEPSQMRTSSVSFQYHAAGWLLTMLTPFYEVADGCVLRLMQ